MSSLLFLVILSQQGAVSSTPASWSSLRSTAQSCQSYYWKPPQPIISHLVYPKNSLSGLFIYSLPYLQEGRGWGKTPRTECRHNTLMRSCHEAKWKHLEPDDNLRPGSQAEEHGAVGREMGKKMGTTTVPCWGTSGPRHTYLASVLHVVLLSRMRADPGAGAGCALFGATQDDGILVQVPSPLHCDADRPRLLTDVIARGTQKNQTLEICLGATKRPLTQCLSVLFSHRSQAFQRTGNLVPSKRYINGENMLTRGSPSPHEQGY